MSRRVAVLLLLLIGSIGASSSPDAPSPAARSSPVAAARDGSLVVTVDPDSDSISVIELTSRAVVEIRTGRDPQTVALSDDGSTAFVANRDDDTISVVDIATRRNRSLPACREPFGVLPLGEMLYVSCFGESKIAIIEIETGRRIATIEVEIDPRGLAISPDGKKLYVTHFTSGTLSVVDIASARVERVIATLADSNLSQSIFIDPAANLAYLPQTRSNASNQALLFDTTLFPIVSVIDLATNASVNAKRISIDVADRPSGIPIDAVRAGDRLFVVHAASNDLSAFDLKSGRAVAHLAVGANPRGMALSPDEKKLYVNNTLDGTVTVIDALALHVDETIRVTSLPLVPRILNGKRLFNSSSDPRLAKDRWMSCASCHFDGAMDRRTWFFRDGPRNTTSLLGVGETAPFHWSGDLDELHDAENTIRVIQAGSGLAAGPSNCEPACDQAPPNGGRSQDLDDLDAFMRTLRLHPRMVAGFSEAANRGREIFFSSLTRCGACHPAPHFTDHLRHDVGTVTDDREKKGPFMDTPALLGVVDTAPYLHDGSALTLLDVLKKRPSGGPSHGDLSHLDEQQLQELVAFMESLGSYIPRRRAVRRSP